MNNFEIRVLSEADWRNYKVIRLESLSESPDAFASTYAREASFTSEQWKSRLRISASMHDVLAIAAVTENLFVGLLSCVIHDRDTKSAHMYQMWVSPGYRNQGIGSALIDYVKSWAAEKEVSHLLLSVTTVNTDAVSLYQSTGFTPVGEPELLRREETLESQPMEMQIGRSNVLEIGVK